MFAHHLLSGSTQSCGKPSCRERPATLKPRPRSQRAPNGLRVLSLDQLRKAWAAYHSPDTSKQRSIPQLAKRHRVNVSSLYDIFRTVRDMGGLDDYLAAITKD